MPGKLESRLSKKKKERKKKQQNTWRKQSPFLFIFSTNPTQTHLKTLKFLERLDGLAGAGEHTENVEANRLAQRPALPDGNRIAFHDTECGRNMRRDVFMALFVTAVFGNVVQVVPADDQRAVHLGGDDGASQDTSTDRDEASEGTLLVNVGALNGRLGRLEPQANVLVPSASPLPNSALCGTGLLSGEDVGLLLESTLRLDGKFGGHGWSSRAIIVEGRGGIGR